MFFRRNEGQYRETDRVTRFKLVKSECERLFVAIYRFPTACDGTLRPAVNWRKVAHRAAIFTLFYHSHATTLH